MSTQLYRTTLFLITLVSVGCSQPGIPETTDATPNTATESDKTDLGNSQPALILPEPKPALADQKSTTQETTTAASIFPDTVKHLLQRSAPISSGEELRSEVDTTTKHLTKALPGIPDILELRARFLNLAGDLDGAETTWKSAIQINPNYGYAYHGLGNIAKLRGNFDQAIQHFRKSEETQPDNADLIQDLANTLFTNGDSATAVKILNRFLERNPASAEILLLHGNACLAEKNFELAESSFSQVLQLSPNSARAREGLISALVRLGRREEARKILAETKAESQTQDAATTPDVDAPAQTLADELKDCSEIYFQACSVLAAMGFPKDAELLAQRSTVFNPKNLKSWRALIGFSQLESNKKMLQTCQAMTLANPGDPTTHFELGTLQLHAGNSQAAKLAFKEVIQLSPSDPAGYAGAVRAAILAQDELPEAMLLATKLVEFAPTSEHYDLLAQTHALMGDFESAWQVMQTAIAKDPDNKKLQFAISQLKKIRAKSP